MLLEFKTKNYKSFVDEMNFVMTPAPKQKGLDYRCCGHIQNNCNAWKHKNVCYSNYIKNAQRW